MDDIRVGAEIGREVVTRVLQIRDAQMHGLTCDRYTIEPNDRAL